MRELKNGTKIIGIDHGYGNIKTANTVTPTGITAYTSEPTFSGNILKYDGMYYRIGEGHKEFIADKALDNDFYIFTLMAIARELNQSGLTEADVHIAAGLQIDKETFSEKQMKLRGKETFKDELREVIQVEIADPENKTFDDVIKALHEHYNVEVRVAGNTISYRHPEYKDKNEKLVSVRGSKLGELYTRKGIDYGLTQKSNVARADSFKPSTAFNAEYELDRAAAGIKSFVAEYSDTSGTGQTEFRGQISGIPSFSDDGQALQDIDRFYDRYRKRSEENEQRTNEASEPSRAVQKRNQGRSR